MAQRSKFNWFGERRIACTVLFRFQLTSFMPNILNAFYQINIIPIEIFRTFFFSSAAHSRICCVCMQNIYIPLDVRWKFRSIRAHFGINGTRNRFVLLRECQRNILANNSNIDKECLCVTVSPSRFVVSKYNDRTGRFIVNPL